MVETLTSAIASVMATPWVYPLMGVLIFLDCFLPLFPSELPLNMAGTWYGSMGYPHLPTTFVVGVLAAMAGDNFTYLMATRLMPLINRAQPGTSTYRALQWVKRNMRRNAATAIIIARFIPSARFIMTVLLGAMRFHWPLFFLFDTIGVILWAAQGLAIGWVGGKLFGDNPFFGAVASIFVAIALGFGVQKIINTIMNWRDVRRGYAETP